MSAYQYSHAGARSPRAGARVRWDRLGRVALLGVLGALLFLYVHAGVSLLSTWREAGQTKSAVATMRREYRQLEAQQAQLQTAPLIETDARRLGMAYPGERVYSVRGLPNN
jgi:cell division protein FtsB